MSRVFAALGLTLGLLLGVLSLIPESLTATSPQIGSVTQVRNSASAWRDGGRIPLESGTAVFNGDRLETGEKSRLEVALTDGTKLTLGAEARLKLADYVFDPDSDIGELAIDALAGPFRFVTGQIGAIADKRVAIATPYATIGIRGTDFWGGPIRGNYGVLLLEGVVDVTNAGVTRTLDRSGAGVDIPSPDAPPGPVIDWGQSKIDEALATVAFTQ